MRCSLLAALALVACNSGSHAPATTAPPAADPWANQAPKVDASKDPDLAAMVALATGGPGPSQYPQADAVIASDRDDVTLGSDGTVSEHHKQIVKLLDAQRGKQKFADVHIPFDSQRQTLDIQVARTVNDDGKPHAVAPEEIGDIVPAWLADATIYSSVRERVVSFPAVDKGSVIELEYTLTTKATPDAPLGGELLLASWDPTLDRVVTITTPAGTAPKFAVDGADVRPSASVAAGNQVLTFELKNLPDRQPENGSPVDAAVLPRLVYGFQPSWAKVEGPIADRFLRAAVPPTLPDAVKRQADQLVAGATSDDDKAQRLFAFVAHDIRSVELPLGLAGYEPHGPEVVLQNRYGDERDKVGLLLALAAAEGIRGRPVLARAELVQVLPGVPTVAQFDRMLAQLRIDGKDVWLGPSDEDAQYGIAFSGQDNAVLPLDRGGTELGHRAPLDPATSVSQISETLALSPAGDLDATYRYDLTGWYADRASGELRPLKGQNLDQFFERSAAQLSAAALDKGHEVSDTMSVTGPIEVTQHVSAPGYAAAQAGFRVLELPPVTLGLADDVPAVGLSTRKYPLRVFAPRTEKADVTLQVPAGWKVAYVPPRLDGSADGVTYSSSCQAAGQTVTCHDELKLDRLTIAPDKYPQFRDALARLQAYERRVVLLTKA